MAVLPAEADAIALLQALVHAQEELREFAHVDVTNAVGLVDAIIAEALGDFSDEVVGAARGWAGALAGARSPAAVRSLLTGGLREYLRVAGYPYGGGYAALLSRLDQHWRRRSSGTITGITQANPGVVTSASHGLSDGDWVYVTLVAGMTEVNKTRFIVASATTNTFALTDESGANVATTGYTAYSSGGLWEQLHVLQSRAISFGTPAAEPGRVGNGTLYRCTVDEDGYAYDRVHAEVKRFLCDADQNQLGTRHEETFSVLGEEAEPTRLKVAGSGIDVSGALQAVTSVTTERVVVNPTFSQFAGTAPTTGNPTTPGSVTEITGWTLDAVTGVTIDVDKAYRDRLGETKTYSVGFAENRTISQNVGLKRRAKFARGTPYLIAYSVYRASTADGTLTFTIGERTHATTISGLSDGAWTRVVLARDLDSWAKNFAGDEMVVKWALTGWSTGTVYIDDLIIAPMTLIDGTWWAYDGATTPAMVGDEIRATDTDPATGGVISRVLGFDSGARFQLPTTAQTPTIADP